MTKITIIVIYIGHDLSKIKKSNIFTTKPDTSFFKKASIALPY